MAAKLLHSLADDNPDLQKQIGCMTGIFQLFDRHHVLAPRHKRISAGNPHFGDGSLETDSNNMLHQQTTMDMNFKKGVNEKQRTSTESSRPSFSSCSSSLSSLDCKAEAEATFDGIVFPETLSTISPHLARHTLDLRDVVKDSMYREPRGLSVKTTAKEEAAFHTMKHKDSPRPFRPSKAVDGCYGVGIDGKHSVPVDLNDSMRVLAKLREAPWYYGEMRPSHEVKDGKWHSISKDSPRFAYDRRETSRFSFESHDTIKSTPKIREFPRHSLDSREGTWRGHNAESKPSHHSSKAYSCTSTSNNKVSSPQQSSTIQSRPPSVVAKLMGLEALPDSALASYTQSSPGETYTAQDNGQFPISRDGFTWPLRVSSSPKISLKDPTSPRRKNADLVMKPISSARVPIEPAPWKQQDGNRSSQKTSSTATKAPARTPDSFTSVYSDIEKRLKDLEFKQSGRDLRALKQILEAMQEKGLLDNRKEEQAPNVARNQRDYEPKVINLIENSTSARHQNPQGNNALSSTIKGYDSARAFESPIVIMKPAKFVEKTRISASSVTPIGSQKLQSSGAYVNKNALSSTGEVKDQPSNTSHCNRDASTSAVDKKARNGKTMKQAQTQTRSQQFPRENSPSSVKHSRSVSPRMQQKKLELDKRARPPAPPVDSNKPRRLTGKKTAELGPPAGKIRPKGRNSRPGDEQMSEASTESRSLSCQGDDVSLKSDGITVDSKTDIEFTSSLRSAEIEDGQSPSLKAMKQLVSQTVQKSSERLDQEMFPQEVKIHQSCSADNENQDLWNTADSLSFNSSGEMNRKKLQSIDHLVQKLRRLNSSHDEARIDYIASLCENTNPDHRYVSEILLASGLLLRDLSSELLTFQLHTSGHPINPELFLVLEQTKASSLLAKEESTGKVAYPKLNAEKFHRKLIFDAVNEILGVKLGSSTELWFQPSTVNLAKKTVGAQKLLKELCFEIEKMQAKNHDCSLEEEDSLKSMLMEDVMHGSESWTEFNRDLPGVVLDVERLIFKDLVDEVVIGESVGLRVKSSVRRRRQFRK
ncbi:protein LONGIFOLIA 2 [Arachis duranensis]|uniref:Protein LONGIFOLIA 2 n=1 Tax=Arachis duranensis TaxID=130453 RepID=A0A9C6TJU8_ARADU|nr:protein LONGIFOLIA 2 [Arachis duranensis]